MPQGPHGRALHVVEGAHVVWADGAVAVQVHALEPVRERGPVALVFLAQHEVDKVLVAHPAKGPPPALTRPRRPSRRGRSRRRSRKRGRRQGGPGGALFWAGAGPDLVDPVDDGPRELVVTVLEEVLPGQPPVVVRVQLPVAAVEDVKVLVAEEARHSIDVILGVGVAPGPEKVGLAALPAREAAGSGGVGAVHHPAGHRHHVLLLKLGVVA
mmetsp:Transcript_8153/g.18601  ORF Transcript_8153/g.18601 Transcript_8153/m.18601 type:complete len:212 (-) Transcript_8153:631-1266(-)